MTGEGIQPLLERLRANQSAIIEAWLARTLQTYPEHTSRFLLQEKDPFRNPVGHTLKEAFPALFDQLVGGMDSATITPVLDGIVRIRAVQDFTAGQAVGFLFLLKKVVREALRGEIRGYPDGDGLAAVEGRIDEMALLAFDLFMKCRERMYEIKANEAKRRIYVLERMYGMEPSVTRMNLPLFSFMEAVLASSARLPHGVLRVSW
jgi:hypothetical protein